MKLTPPKQIVFWISLLLGVLGIVFSFVPETAAFALWVVAAGWLLLVLGNVVEDF